MFAQSLPGVVPRDGRDASGPVATRRVSRSVMGTNNGTNKLRDGVDGGCGVALLTRQRQLHRLLGDERSVDDAVETEVAHRFRRQSDSESRSDRDDLGGCLTDFGCAGDESGACAGCQHTVVHGRA